MHVETTTLYLARLSALLTEKYLELSMQQKGRRSPGKSPTLRKGAFMRKSFCGPRLESLCVMRSAAEFDGAQASM